MLFVLVLGQRVGDVRGLASGECVWGECGITFSVRIYLAGLFLLYILWMAAGFSFDV